MRKSFRKYTLVTALAVCLSIILPFSAFAAKLVVALDSTHFPDANFRSYLLNGGVSVYRYNGRYYLTEDAIRAKTVMDLRERGIKNLKGIEYFTSLQTLYAGNRSSVISYYGPRNSIETLDLRKLTSLKTLEVIYADVKLLKILGCTKLETIICIGNKLTGLNVGSCTALRYLDCSNNAISGSFSLSNNTNLETLYCENNKITSLTIGSSKLKLLYCQNNQISYLRAIIANPQNVYCYGNKLGYLNFSSRSNSMINIGSNSLRYLSFGTLTSGVQVAGTTAVYTSPISKVVNYTRYKYYVKVGNYTGSYNKSYVSSVTGYRGGYQGWKGYEETGHYDKSTGYAWFQNKPGFIVYYYDIGFNSRTMPVVLNISSSSFNYYTYNPSARPASVSSGSYGAFSASSSPATVNLQAVGDNVLSSGTERDEGIVTVKPGDLTFKLENYEVDGTEKVYVNDEFFDNIEVSEDGKFVLPEELVQEGISVQVKSNKMRSEVLNINVTE